MHESPLVDWACCLLLEESLEESLEDLSEGSSELEDSFDEVSEEPFEDSDSVEESSELELLLDEPCAGFESLSPQLP